VVVVVVVVWHGPFVVVAVGCGVFLFSCVFLIVGTDFIYFAPVIHVTERIFDVAYKKHLG
jgi:hypothetical protein